MRTLRASAQRLSATPPQSPKNRKGRGEMELRPHRNNSIYRISRVSADRKGWKTAQALANQNYMTEFVVANVLNDVFFFDVCKPDPGNGGLPGKTAEGDDMELVLW
jgi:hypothetical protein